jgi:ribosomal protein S27AE
MSYEGHVQAICANGHYYEYDALDEDRSCSECGAVVSWQNHVDDTNCESCGEIPHEKLEKLLLVSPAEAVVCNLGYPHVTKLAVWRVPTNEETDPLRCWRPGPAYGAGDLVPLSQRRAHESDQQAANERVRRGLGEDVRTEGTD